MNHNRNTALERSVKITLGGGLKPVLRDPNLALSFYMAQNIQLFGPREGFLTHQWIITGNK